ncbi:MAG: rRNA maturation RNase YbeY [Rhodobacteraceae bacterium]|nr:rRNA maturation RNase YbeY [Paracoccaceae bacterium]
MNRQVEGSGPGLPADFQIDVAREFDLWPEESELLKVANTAIAAAFRVAPLDVVSGTEVSLVFTCDDAIQRLNGQWRGKDKPTNVLSFPGSDPDEDTYGPLLGDIILAYETIAREAGELDIDFSNHLTHLLVHGILHLFDYDHQEEDEAELMEGLERQILASLDIADPYTDEPLSPDGD